MGFGRGKGFSPPPAAVVEHTTKAFACVEPEWYRPTSFGDWYDFDLSRVVAKGATGALFHLLNRDAGEERAFGLRKKGSTQDYHGSFKRHSHSWAIVGLDENRKCQGYYETPGVQDFLLIGYVGENFTFFTDGYDITPATKQAWVDIDLSAYCPGAIAAIIEIASHLDGTCHVGARKHGSTDDRHEGGRHMWMVVGLDASQHLDLYDYGTPVPCDAINLIGYITAGVTMYTNADDISPTADGTYKFRSLTPYKAEPIIAFIEVESSVSTQSYAIRKHALAPDIYYDVDNHNFAMPHPNTPNDGLRIKLESDAIHLYLLGIG